MTAKRLPIVAIMTVMTCMTAVLAVSPAGASAYTLTGAGSTLVQPLETFWASDYQSKYGDTINYARRWVGHRDRGRHRADG